MTGIRRSVLVGLAAVTALWASASWAQQPEAERIELKTDDEKTVVAYWIAQSGPVGGPTALLIHNQGSTRFGWQPMLPYLEKAGFQVLVLDLRGHGDSKGTAPDVYAEMIRRNNEPYHDMIYDVRAAIRWLVEEAKVPEERIALIGGAHGANLAIQAGAEHAGVAAVVALSPSRHFFGFPVVEYAGRYAKRPLLVIITKQYQSRGASEIQELNRDNNNFEMKVFPRYELHGTQLLNLSWKVEDRIIKWLQKVMELESS